MRSKRLLIETFIHIHFCNVAEKRKRRREKAKETNRSPKRVLGILDEIHHLMIIIFL